jgi:hypothetical protein
VGNLERLKHFKNNKNTTEIKKTPGKQPSKDARLRLSTLLIIKDKLF